MIEIIHNHIERGRIRSALFDFDGTVSLIREGWQQIMISMMVEWLLQTPEHKGEAELCRVVTEYVTRLTGKQTIYQMIQLAEEIAKRGGQPAEPLTYKRMYLARLGEHIKDRVTALKAGHISTDEMMVPGTRMMLEAMHARKVRGYLASGTDEPAVLDEAAALQITPHFVGIYGAQDDYKRFSKKILIERIIAKDRLDGPEFVAFGDGFVEIEETKRVNGIAVGVASNEATRTGINEWKRRRLIEAGADIIVPDFRQHQQLVAYLFDE